MANGNSKTTQPSKKASSLPEEVQDRREALKACGGSPDRLPEDACLGIAFSGGGIRSATISLGMAQCLTRYQRLLSFDYVSTVSGGGYFGSFLRSLFVPDSIRGSHGRDNAVALDDIGDAVRKRHDFALRALASQPHDRTIEGPDKSAGSPDMLLNPVWWLREHGRYLAPNGPTDFIFAISHISRNWIAMLYVFAIAMLALFTFKTLFMFGLVKVLTLLTPQTFKWLKSILEFNGHALSPVFPLAALAGLAGLSIGAAFWMTEGMHAQPGWLTGRSNAEEAQPNPGRTLFGTGIVTSAAALSLIAVRHFWAGAPELAGSLLLLTIWVLVGMVVFAAGALLLVNLRLRLTETEPNKWQNPTAEIRRVLTQGLTRANQWLAFFLAVSVIDSLAIYLSDINAAPVSIGSLGNLTSVALLPALAWLIQKAPEWRARLTGGKRKVQARWLNGLALTLGLLAFGSVAVLADSVVHRAAWEGWVLKSDPALVTFGIFATVVALLFVMTGTSDGFINLSSLHGFYASRLTRAFLGATNIDRLREQAMAARTDTGPIGAVGSGININKSKDYIDMGLYQRVKIPAPLHLINVTLNETRSGNSMVDRARKGVLMVFCPEGARIGCSGDELSNTVRSWQELRDQHSEPLGVGQLCAISGAAASAGMGRMTTLGGALALTFANVRLGYWWVARTIDGASGLRSVLKHLLRLESRFRLVALVETYIYLFNELTARYSRQYRRHYLSDGGHFENSGALELVRRACKLILVADNGADPEFAFGDMEILIRTARLDLGKNIRMASATETRAFAGDEVASCFFNTLEGDWRAAAKEPGGQAYVLLLNIWPDGPPGETPEGRILWFKPRQFDGLAEDLRSYIQAHPAFPHESTGDQFFDEAQWESYRRIGVEMILRLMRLSPKIREAIPATSGEPPSPEPAPQTSRSPNPRPARRRSSPA